MNRADGSIAAVAMIDRPNRPPAVNRVSTLRDLVSTVIAAAVTELVSREDRLRTIGDPDDVHRARVATRRLRAQLRTLRPVLDPQWTETVNHDLKTLAAALGEIRDADVLFQELSAQAPSLPDLDVTAGRVLAATVLSHRDEAYARLKAVLPGENYQILVGRLQAAAGDPPLRPGDELADVQARTLLPDLVAKQWNDLARAVHDLSDDPSITDLHEIRKRAKKLRYGAEMAAPAIGKPAKRLAKAAEHLQGVLGEVHDAAMTEIWLRHQVIVAGDSSLALAAGELLERERRRLEANRDEWPRAWKRVHHKRLRG